MLLEDRFVKKESTVVLIWAVEINEKLEVGFKGPPIKVLHSFHGKIEI